MRTENFLEISCLFSAVTVINMSLSYFKTQVLKFQSDLGYILRMYTSDQ